MFLDQTAYLSHPLATEHLPLSSKSSPDVEFLQVRISVKFKIWNMDGPTSCPWSMAWAFFPESQPVASAKSFLMALLTAWSSTDIPCLFSFLDCKVLKFLLSLIIYLKSTFVDLTHVSRVKPFGHYILLYC